MLSVGSPHRVRTSDDLGGRDAEEFLDLGLVEQDVLGRIVDRGRGVDDLEEVLVGRDDDGPHALGRGPDGQAGQHVVGFVAGVFEERDAEGRQDLLEPGDLA